MISHVADPDTARTTKPLTVVFTGETKGRWWSRMSPWLWGLLALSVIAATQVPRLSHVFSPGPSPHAVAATSAPGLSGVAYSQAMVATMNFANTDLRGARLVNLDLRGKKFHGANAAGAIFSGSLLDGADFSGADLRGANFSGACLQGSDLTGAKLAGANFTEADVAGTSITSAAVSNVIGWNSIVTSPKCTQS
jgi:hypothetical protein